MKLLFPFTNVAAYNGYNNNGDVKLFPLDDNLDKSCGAMHLKAAERTHQYIAGAEYNGKKFTAIFPSVDNFPKEEFCDKYTGYITMVSENGTKISPDFDAVVVLRGAEHRCVCVQFCIVID